MAWKLPEGFILSEAEGLRSFARSELVPSLSRDLPIGQKGSSLCALCASVVKKEEFALEDPYD
jgi:hypothetical protein